MSREVRDKLTDALALLIEQLIDLQASLHATLGEKLEAMRRAETPSMLATSRREGELVAHVGKLNDQRKKVAAELCKVLGMGGGGDVTLRTLAGRLAPDQGRRLTSLGDRLRTEMLKVAEANEVVQLVSREMLNHFKGLFATMMRTDEDAATYSAGGDLDASAGARVLDAVG